MHKLIMCWSLLIAVAYSSYVFAGGYRVTVGTNLITVVPAAKMGSAATWVTTNAYPQGAYVESSADGNVYMALIAGTSGTNAPAGNPTVTDGTVTWVRCQSSTRKVVSISVDAADGPVYIQPEGIMPTVPAGIRLNASGGNATITGNDAQGSVKAATASGTNVLVIATW